MKQILIVDALNLFLYNFTVNPMMDTNGEHIGGSIGFLTSLKNIIRLFQPDKIITVWDGEGGSLRRRSLYKDYKAGRAPKLNREYDFENPEKQIISMRKQIEDANKYLSYLPVINIKFDGVEADDVIAYITNFMFDDDIKTIVSTDRDFFQLVNEKVSVYSPRVKKVFLGHDVKESLGVIPENVIYFKAVTGDASDNIKGVRGIGKKTFVKLFPFTAEKETTLLEMKQYALEHIKEKKNYTDFLEQLNKVEENIKLMQLSNPLMDTKVCSAIRKIENETEIKFRYTDLTLKFHLNNVQIKASDFFSVFSEQHKRTMKGDELNE